MNTEAKTLIIVAGGSGTRMKSAIPKQFIEIDGIPIIFHTIDCFTRVYNNIQLIIALPANEFERWERLCKAHSFTFPHSLAKGGKTRFHSVKSALSACKPEGTIAVHDSVRPLVSKQTITMGFEMASKKGSAIPVTDLKESLRKHTDSANMQVNRSEYKIVQTPQVFNAQKLISAYKQDFSNEFTDDASVFEKAGNPIYTYPGNDENIKITTPVDLELFRILYKKNPGNCSK
mgnify:CR=1 FL=1